MEMVNIMLELVAVMVIGVIIRVVYDVIRDNRKK